MGTDASKEASSEYGQIFVQIDQTSYSTGDTVTGKIHLNITKTYPGKDLFLKFKGKERVHLLEGFDAQRRVQQNGQANTLKYGVDKLFEEKKDVISGTVPVHTWTELSPGQFSFPFAFALPTNIPSTFYQRGYRYIADISYRISAVVEPLDKALTPRLKDQQPLIVREAIRAAVQGPSNEILTNLKSCCLGQGSNVLHVGFEKNTYVPGEIAQVSTQLDNTKSRLDNNAIQFTLKQNLTLTTNDRMKYMPLMKIQRPLPGVAAGQSSSKSMIALNLPPCKYEDYKKLQAHDLSKYLLEDIQETEIMSSTTTKGSLIKSNFVLEVTCPMKGCSVQTPNVTLPIQIQFPESQPLNVTAPENWNPQIMETVNIAFQTGYKSQRNQSMTMNTTTNSMN